MQNNHGARFGGVPHAAAVPPPTSTYFVPVHNNTRMPAVGYPLRPTWRPPRLLPYPPHYPVHFRHTPPNARMMNSRGARRMRRFNASQPVNFNLAQHPMNDLYVGAQPTPFNVQPVNVVSASGLVNLNTLDRQMNSHDPSSRSNDNATETTENQESVSEEWRKREHAVTNPSFSNLHGFQLHEVSELVANVCTQAAMVTELRAAIYLSKSSLVFKRMCGGYLVQSIEPRESAQGTKFMRYLLTRTSRDVLSNVPCEARRVDNDLLHRLSMCLEYPTLLREVHTVLFHRVALPDDMSPSDMDCNSEFIWRVFNRHHQCSLQFERKIVLYGKLMLAMRDIGIPMRMAMIGSSVTGFGTDCSDVDICLLWATEHPLGKLAGLSWSLLDAAKECLADADLVDSANLINAKVPILRLSFKKPFDGIRVDINANNPIGVRNSHLLRYYAMWDWRVRPLVMAIKCWAKLHGINNAAKGTFSSYSLVLMTISFLQCGTDPPVLPSLQELLPNCFSLSRPLEKLVFDEGIKRSRRWNIRNRKSLFELFSGFFNYYSSCINFEEDLLSIRKGTVVKRSVAQNDPEFRKAVAGWTCLCVEEPFTKENVAYAVHDSAMFSEVKVALRRTAGANARGCLSMKDILES